jgi:hypothetical protein
MPLHVAAGAPTLFIRKDAFERAELSRLWFDERLNLTAEEFRMERELVAIGPLQAAEDLPALIDELEDLGLVYFDDFFELSGSWPEWLQLYAAAGG